MHLSRQAFDRLVEDAIAALPAEFAQWLDEVPIIVEDRPGQRDRNAVAHEGDEDDPLGMFDGPDISDGRQSGDLPPRVMIYRQPLLQACTSREQLQQEIWKTLVHELGHYAGMDESQLDQLGYGPMDDDDEIEWDVDDPNPSR